MMKKLLTFFLAIVYMSFHVGATLHQHYCMGEHVGTSLFDLKDKKCGKCGMNKHSEKTGNCCKDVSIVVKSTDAHTFFYTAYHFFAPAFIFTDFSSSWDIKINQVATDTMCQAHAPPSLLKTPLFLQHRNFRI